MFGGREGSKEEKEVGGIPTNRARQDGDGSKLGDCRNDDVKE